MAKQTINVGSAPNDHKGDPLRDALIKANSNFDELYDATGSGGTAITELQNEVADLTANKANKNSPRIDNRIDLDGAFFSASWRDNGSGTLGWYVGAADAADGAQFPIAIVDKATGSMTVASGLNVSASNPRASVSHTGVTPSTLRFGADAGITWLGSQTNSPLYFITNGSERARLDASGNLGLGTTTPATKLDVAGAASFTLASYCYAEFNSGAVKGQVAANGGGSVNIRAVSNHPLCLFANNIEWVRVDPTGNVGIGTTTPTVPLHVTGAGTYTALFNGASKGIRFWFTAGTSLIEGVDNTGTASYQPLTLGGSVLLAAATFTPTTHNSFDLGATAARWKKLWSVDAEFTNSPIVPTPTLGDASTKAASTQFVANAVSNAGVAAGAILPYQMTTAPAGWLKANGAAVSLISYPGLLAIYVGNTDNPTATSGYRCANPANPNGTRSTTGDYIVLPDYRGEFLRGWDDGRGIDTGRTIWSAQAHMFQDHNHELTAYAAAGSFAQTGASVALSNVGNTAISFAKSGNFGSETRGRNLAALFCIKY
ncbi:hypothetical protein AB4099_19080 [Bosea sp. 2KB_26]|uniref:phage tail protein n=1 Tax=Bosea sp. 2KB_26 TaxID=3237475 RepID=UPI003F8E9C5D